MKIGCVCVCVCGNIWVGHAAIIVTSSTHGICVIYHVDLRVVAEPCLFIHPRILSLLKSSIIIAIIYYFTLAILVTNYLPISLFHLFYIFIHITCIHIIHICICIYVCICICCTGLSCHITKSVLSILWACLVGCCVREELSFVIHLHCLSYYLLL